ncbi:TauD/TfdA family dioxygenase [Streptomyces sp. NPDC053079]|uniref:TauD/TfdA family dioxygenase n=1 Tax=Streptomyces sp. NPDC053079 TaxID=3365697 RepID=UPI0037CE8AC8
MPRSAPAPGLQEIVLTANEVRPADDVIRGLATEYGSTEDLGLLTTLAGCRDTLPARLSDALAGARSRQGCPVTVVRRPRPAEDIGATPPHWRLRGRTATAVHDLWLALVAVQVGDPVCWQTLQDGRLFNDVLPIEGQERAQTGHSSVNDLAFHVEDAFDDDRCDMLALMCLRNRERTATTVATTSRIDVGTEEYEPLYRPRFAIRPDPEHLKAGAAGDLPPVWRPVVFGDSRSQPYLRVDPTYTTTAPGDEMAERAFARLCRQLERALVRVRLRPGDLMLIDNYRAVHGREPFRPRYDGTDRWLRKLTLTFDLQRSLRRRQGGGRALALS